MSPRAKRIRIIRKAPHFAGFKPFGLPQKESDKIMLLYEEYEAIKLCDYELLTQLEASAFMQVSRPTFTRVYESARRKIAKAFAEGLSIIIEGGSSIVDSSWHRCSKCEINFSTHAEDVKTCPLCGTINIEVNKSL